MKDEPTRAYKWQLKKRQEGLCFRCGGPIGQSTSLVYCAKCVAYRKANWKKNNPAQPKVMKGSKYD